MSAAVKSAISSALGMTVFALLIFVPAGTIDYWQGWVFLAIFAVVSTVPSVYLNRVDPAAIARRRKAGPGAETRLVQKMVMTAITVSFAVLLVVSGLDYRFGWSKVPTAVSIAGDVMVAVGLGVSLLVVFQNRYAAATITVEDGQPLASTGLYTVVRHPMYAASVVMMIGMIPDMPEMLNDVRAWQPKSYADHFRDSGFAAKDVAIEAYAHSPAQFRAPFDLTIERLNTEVAENVETLTRLVAAGDAAELRATAEESSRQLQSLIELASSIISGNAMNQAEIDRMLRKG